jgi:hypothetical protein
MSVLIVLVSFGVIALTPVQLDAIGGLLVAVAGVLPIVQGLFTERRVFSPDTHLRELGVDYEAGLEAGKKEAGPRPD